MGEKVPTGSRVEKVPPWWPTAEAKLHADAGCAHPNECKVRLRDAMRAAGLIRGGEVAARLGLPKVEFDWRGESISGYRIADVDRLLTRTEAAS